MFEEEKIVKKRKLCDIVSNQGSMEDRISKLPEDLICFHILSRLRTIDAVKTSLLSTKWRNLWKRVPVLALEFLKFSNFTDFASFINKFLYFHKDSLIRKFQLRIYDPDRQLCDFNTDDRKSSYVPQWIDEVSSKHKIQHLDFSFGNSGCLSIVIPLSLYTCETLVHLRLVGITMVDSKFVSLPCLKSIDLRSVRCPKVTIVEKLISSSPVLDDLTILTLVLGDNVDAKPVRLQSQTLERICIDDFSYHTQVVAIDAPLLHCLTIRLRLCCMSRTIYSGLSPKVQVCAKLKCCDLKAKPNEISMIRDNLTNISTMVKDLVIRRSALKFIYRFSNVESLPQFGCLSCLNVNLCVSKLKWFPTFLESCPSLKSLSMELHFSSKKKKKKKKYKRFESVPECLSTSLECVEIKTVVSEDAIEVKVVKYFLNNALILRKLTLKLNSHPRKKDIFKKIRKFPRRSVASKLVLL